jgi:hypothetical protein
LAYCAGIAAVDRLVEPVFFGRFIDVKKQTTLEEYDLSENLIHLILIRQPKRGPRRISAPSVCLVDVTLVVTQNRPLKVTSKPAIKRH